MKSMTVKLSISVPDEVAARAQASGNASKWFTTAGTRLLAAESYLAAGVAHMARTGVTVADEGVAAAGAVMDAAQQRLSPEARAAMKRGPRAYRDFLAAEQASPATAA